MEGGFREIGFLWQDQREKRHLHTMTASQSLCVYLTSTEVPVGLLKIFQDSSLYYVN